MSRHELTLPEPDGGPVQIAVGYDPPFDSYFAQGWRESDEDPSIEVGFIGGIPDLHTLEVHLRALGTGWVWDGLDDDLRVALAKDASDLTNPNRPQGASAS